MQVASAEGSKRGGEWAWLLSTLGHGARCTALISDHYRVYHRLRDPDAVRRPAARRFVRDAQSAVRLSESRGMSVRAAAAGIIAANLSAVHTDSPLQRSRWQRLPAAAQRF